MIVDSRTLRATVYKPCELIKDARRLVRGKGKLHDYFVKVNSNGNVQLIAHYKQPNGMVGQESEAI